MKIIISILVIIGFTFSFIAQNIEYQFPKTLKASTVSSPEFQKIEDAKKQGLSRKVIELSFFEELSHTQIAEHLSLPLGTVKSRIRMAFTTLRNELGDYQ